MKSNNLPFSVTLRDLAILRASGVDLATVLEPQEPSSNGESLERSREFIKEARAALKIANSDSVDRQGASIEELLSMGRGKRERTSTLRPGEELHIGGKDVSIDSVMNATEFQAAVDNRPNPVPVPVKSSTSLKPGGLLSNIRKPFTPLRPSNNGKATSLLQGSTKPVLSDPQYPPSKARVHVTELFEDEGEPIGEKSKAPKGPRVDASFEGLWSVNWRKANTKKNKTWDGDGIVHQKGTIVRFMSDDMKKVFGSKTWDTALDVGSKLWIGEKETKEAFLITTLKIEVDAKLPLSRLNGQFSEEVIDLETREEVPKPGNVLPIGRKFTAPAIVKQVERQENVAVRKPKPIEPLHDPTAPNAIVMKSPSTTHQQRFNPNPSIIVRQRPIVPVVIDPLLGAKLRPHQIEGVKFMYEAVMGMRAHEGQEQNPYAGSGPVIGKAMIVCPVSLVENWRKEFHKWFSLTPSSRFLLTIYRIGRDRIGVFTGNCSKVEIKQFINSRIHQVLIIGYERLRGIIQDLAYCNPPIGLVVCDEGHRLKSAGSKTAKMFTALRTPKRIILSGTPIQNDLSEFHAMADFCNPGVLDDYPNFKRTFENPIIASRMPDCSSNTLQKGRDKAEQLQLLSKSFVLRREATILSNYLPPKYEYVVFVSPTELQLAMITHLLHPDNLHRLTDSTAKSLALIQTLSKLCNSPYLLKKKAPSDDSFSEAIRMIPAQAREDDVSLSGKLTALGAILKELLATTSEKCIIVSHYTSTLDIIEAFCRKQRYKLFRLDGRTPQVQRQELVDKFNKSSQSESYLFLLSAKAGGVGLNLIGASRLVLVDGDWNP
ncbi:helicase, partial [Serendipita sp. 399]